MANLQNKHILLGVTGGIAAYKSADLVRRLQDAGASVRVVMTESAQKLVAPLTFQALSGQPVLTGWDQPESAFAMDHIALARWADSVLIAPATADFMAKLAYGFADDVLGTICLATAAPIWIAPAMNQQMWKNNATQANLHRLQAHGIKILGPGQGSQACGDEGLGRMWEPQEIIAALSNDASQTEWQGLRVLITAGPTQEPIDPVRYIGNRSSGKMGYALAGIAATMGAEVTLISGPTQLPYPDKVKCHPINTAEQMYQAVMATVKDCDIFIAAAAVADYHCEVVAPQKIKKRSEGMTLKLIPNPDIVKAVTSLPNPPFTIGFAAETEALEQHARTKLHEKKLNMIAANDVSDPQAGFGSDNNALQVFWSEGQCTFDLRPKQALAKDLWHLIIERYHQLRGASQK